MLTYSFHFNKLKVRNLENFYLIYGKISNLREEYSVFKPKLPREKNTTLKLLI